MELESNAEYENSNEYIIRIIIFLSNLKILLIINNWQTIKNIVDWKSKIWHKWDNWPLW